MESLESLAGKRSALRPLRGDGPRRAAIKGERERLLDDLKRSCLGDSERDLLMDVRNQVGHKKLTETGTCVQILSSPLARDEKRAFGLSVVKNAACAVHPRSLDPEQNWDKARHFGPDSQLVHPVAYLFHFLWLPNRSCRVCFNFGSCHLLLGSVMAVVLLQKYQVSSTQRLQPPFF